MKDKRLCTTRGCFEPRWHGPNGDQNLFKCEEHQREDWRRRGSKKYRARKANVSQDTPAPNRTPINGDSVKVVLVDHRRDLVQMLEVPLLSQKKLSDVKHADRLIAFLQTTGHIVVEVGKEERPVQP